jgi:hypothetical protein
LNLNLYFEFEVAYFLELDYDLSAVVRSFSDKKLFPSLSPPAREQAILYILLPLFSADKNDQITSPACGKAIRISKPFGIIVLTLLQQTLHLYSPSIPSCLDLRPMEETLQNALDRAMTVAPLLQVAPLPTAPPLEAATPPLPVQQVTLLKQGAPPP